MRSRGNTHLQRYRMAQNVAVKTLGMVMLDQDGLARPAQTLAGNKGVIGIAIQDQTTPGNNDWIITQQGVFLLPAAALTQAIVGNTVSTTDGTTVNAVTTTNKDDPIVGVVQEFVDPTLVWVRIGEQT